MNLSYTTTNGTQVNFCLPTDPTLSEALEAILNFLRACGYVIPYELSLELVGPEETDEH